MKVWVNKPRCTGCSHCKDVCPVAVFEMKGRKNPAEVNTDVAPDNEKWNGTTDADDLAKWKDVQDGHKHFADEYDGSSGGISVAVNGEACILCQACLVECEGECITIVDDNNQEYHSVYKNE